MKKRANVELGAVLAAVGDDPDLDDLDTRMLDAAEEWLRTTGLRRWSIDDVAASADVGRTTVYRRFGDRDNLVHAVLARELRATLADIRDAVADAGDLEAKAAAGLATALRALDGSVVDELLRSDPETFLPFLTTDAGPLLAVAREVLTAQMANYVDDPSPELAEAAARFGLSIILTRSTVLPLDDEKALGAAVSRMIRPFFVAGGLTAG